MFNGNMLKQVREKKQVSQAELSKACHVSQGLISLWETGSREPDTDALHTLSRYFNIPADLLLTDYHPQALAMTPNSALVISETDDVSLAQKVHDALLPLQLDTEVLSPLLLYVDFLEQQRDR